MIDLSVRHQVATLQGRADKGPVPVDVTYEDGEFVVCWACRSGPPIVSGPYEFVAVYLDGFIKAWTTR